MKKNKNSDLRKLLGIAVLMLTGLLVSCAVTQTDIPENETARLAATPVRYPAYDGPKIPLAVIPMGLSEKAAKRYPHLLEKSVGLGVHNMLTDALYRTGRFRFVEDREAMLQESFKWQKLGAAGIVDESSAVRIGRMLGAQKIIYGEVYDYSEGRVESVSGFRASVTPKIRVGIQIRLVNLETLEYIPASCIRYGADWGTASQAAIEEAVFKIISSMP